ncbi:ICE2 family protein [Bacillus pseudomycoides]|nr:ICE2 family protein [Bacillus pseudomycoides]
MDNPMSLAILGSVISIGVYFLYRIDVWDKKTGWSKDER